MRRHGGYDPAYEGPVWSTPTQAREALGLAAVALAHAPLFPIAPFHYEHHLGDQDRNFGIVWAWCDLLAGTREAFIGTAKERAMHGKHAARAEIAKAGAALRAQRRGGALGRWLQRVS